MQSRYTRPAGMGDREPSALWRAAQHSHAVVTAWHGSEIVGIGRVVSDGVYYATIFDVAVHPAVQGQGIGRSLMEALKASLPPGVRIHLTSTFGNEGFYARLGYARHRTAMAKYPDMSSPYLAGGQLAD